MTKINLLSDKSGLANTARLTAIAAFAMATALAGVFSMPPLDRDEARFAQATAQMLETGDYISIRFQDDERNKKPGGIYWLQAASVRAFSSVDAREIWAYRLPSVAGAVLAAIFTYVAGARLFGPSVGFFAAILLASAPAVACEATIAKTDAMLLGCVAAAQAAFAHMCAAISEERRARYFWPLLFWVSIGAGVLIKGPIILMITAFTAAAMFIRAPKAGWLQALHPATGAFILALMIGPWAYAINEATEGRFVTEAIGGDMLSKITDAKESHGGPPGYYSLLAFVLFWPAAALIVPGVRAAFKDRASWQSWFLLGWAAPAWVLFELTATKLPHYTLPVYPAIALMAANAAFSATPSQELTIHRVGAGAYAVVGLILAAVIGSLPVFYQQGQLTPFCFSAAAALALATIAAASLFWRLRTATAIIAASLVSSALAWTLLGGVLPNLDKLTLSPRISSAIDDAGLHPLRDGAAPSILSGYSEPSAIFLLGTKTILADGREAADFFVKTRRAAVIEAQQERAFLGRLNEIGGGAAKFAVIEGINYSNGKSVTLSIYRPTQPPLLIQSVE